MKLAKADLVPKDTNLLRPYGSFAELEAACEAFCEQVNARVHRVTRRATGRDAGRGTAPGCTRSRRTPHTVAFGVTRVVPANTPMVSFEGGQYSVPAHAARRRRCGSGSTGRAPTSRSSSSTSARPGRSRSPGTGGPPRAARRSTTSHFPPAPAGALDRRPKARNAAEAEFLAIGDGARLWLTEAAAAGTTKMRVKMAQAVALAKLFDAAEVDWALGHAAVHGRFAEADLASILDHHARDQRRRAGEHRAGEDPVADPGHQRLGRARHDRRHDRGVTDDGDQEVAA